MIVESGIGTKLLSRASIASLALLLAALASCSSKDSPKTGGETFATVASTTTTAGSPQPTAYADSGDYVNGRHMAKLTAFDASSVSFDVVQFLTGDAATKAYDEDNHTTGPPDNDYYIRNQNPLIRTLPVASDVVIHVNNAGGYEPSNPDNGHAVNASTLKSYFDAGPAKNAYFWLTITGGTVTAIEEQFVP